MVSDLESLKAVPQRSFQTKELLIVAAWSGILAGIVEAPALLLLQKLNLLGSGLAAVDLPIIWVSPLFDLLLFLTVASGLLLVLRIFPYILRERIAIFSFAFLTFLDWTFVTGRIR